jgi:hypothetical protein
MEVRPDTPVIFEGLVEPHWSEISQALFFEYCLLGPVRTLDKLHAVAMEKWPEAKYTLTRSSLKDMCWRGHWVEKVKEYDRRSYMWVAEDVLTRNHEMNMRHARIGMETLDMAVQAIKKATDTNSLSPNAAVQLVRNAAEVERLANEAELNRENETNMPSIQITVTTADPPSVNPITLLPERIIDAEPD